MSLLILNTARKISLTLYCKVASMISYTQLWGDDVDSFRPERWLNQDGTVRNVPEFIPFGTGKQLL